MENIIFKTKFGSHLYGTNTPSSDTDYKGVYMASLSDIILKRVRDSIHYDTKTSSDKKNTAEDVDCEYIELSKFLKDAMAGQTYALDMLFAPKEMWEKSSSVWEKILDCREKLLSRNVAPYIGYCRQQAGKYGLKGSRLGELIRIIKFLKTLNPNESLLRGIEKAEDCVGSEFVYWETKIHHFVREDKDVPEIFLVVLGKYFSEKRKVKEILESLERMNEEYGERARLAEKNEGVDWKAISHAYRCCFQLMDLAVRRHISFPLIQADFLIRVKKGEIPYSRVQTELPELMERAVKLVGESKLPESPDKEFWKQFILSLYGVS